jgi:Protein kinase domain
LSAPHPAEQADLALGRHLALLGVDRGALERGLIEARRRRAAGQPTTLAQVLHELQLAPLPLLQTALGQVQAGAQRSPGSTESLSGSGVLASTGPASGLSHSMDRSGERIPRQLGPYRVLRELARGGMGAVLEAEHLETGGRYAVKVVLPQLDPEVAEEERLRFAREAELNAQLNHPNVVRIHAAELNGAPPYLVLDLIEGQSIEQRMQRQGPFEVEQAVRLARKVGDALAHAHSKGVLHRDLKPANVILDPYQEPRLVDFGLARDANDQANRLTLTGEILGTPVYMAPEQAMALKEDDRRTDVYALGALLYAMLTGGPPFPEASALQVLNAVVSKPPRPVREARPEVPPALAAVVHRALAKEREERYQDAPALDAALAAAMESDAARSHLVPVLLGVVGCLALVVSVLVTSLGAGDASPDAIGDPPGVESRDPGDVEVAPVPAPPPPPPVQIWPAEPCRYLLERHFVQEHEEEGDYLAWDLDLQPAVDQPADRLRYQGVVRRLRVLVRDGAMTWLEFDSDEPEDENNKVNLQLARIVGPEFRMEVDPASGRVESVDGLPADLDLGEDVSGIGVAQSLQGAFRELEDEALILYLNSVCHLLDPETAATPGTSWELSRPVWVEALAYGLRTTLRVRWEEGQEEFVLEADPSAELLRPPGSNAPFHRGTWAKDVSVSGRGVMSSEGLRSSEIETELRLHLRTQERGVRIVYRLTRVD